MFRLVLLHFILKLFYIFPINSKKIFFSSYEGGPISCNPKYIYLKLKNTYKNGLIYIWEGNNVSETQKADTGATFVKHNSLMFIYHVMTSGVIITNSGISAVFPLREKQLTINTWHGAGCYKKVGRDLAETNNAVYTKRCYYTENNTTYYISGCEAWTKVFSRAVFSNINKFLPYGSPRIDYLLNDISEDRIAQIRKAISVDKRIILYAPTYRGSRDIPEEPKCPIDVPRLLSALQNKFGGDWVFAYRCHYATASQFKQLENTIDLSWYDDMQDLLAVADVLISDYSSSIWDYSFTGKPCFLYCYDLDQYTNERDFYMPIQNWHFPISENMDELITCIDSFDSSQFRNNMIRHHVELGSYENGDATEKIELLIKKHLG